jgi:small subunit ribosomal protein S18
MAGSNKKNNRNNNYDDDNVRIRKPKKKVCAYCADENLEIDFKQADKLRKYVSEKGKILPRRVTGLCAKHQRELTIAIKRARHIALLPFTVE